MKIPFNELNNRIYQKLANTLSAQIQSAIDNAKRTSSKYNRQPCKRLDLSSGDRNMAGCFDSSKIDAFST